MHAKVPPSSFARPGFTLIEVLVAVSILTLGLGSAAALMAGAFGTYRNQNRTLEMNHLVHDQLEKLTSMPYETLQEDLGRARNPGDPVRDALPAQRDFEKTGDNAAVADWEMIPPPEGQNAYTIVRRPTGFDPLLVSSGQRPNRVKAKLRLEYWDPVFDSHSATDKGLVRASFALDWNGALDKGVKYLAR